jgi:hypothetical protein
MLMYVDMNDLVETAKPEDDPQFPDSKEGRIRRLFKGFLGGILRRRVGREKSEKELQLSWFHDVIEKYPGTKYLDGSIIDSMSLSSFRKMIAKGAAISGEGYLSAKTTFSLDDYNFHRHDKRKKYISQAFGAGEIDLGFVLRSSGNTENPDAPSLEITVSNSNGVAYNFSRSQTDRIDGSPRMNVAFLLGGEVEVLHNIDDQQQKMLYEFALKDLLEVYRYHIDIVPY